MQRYFIVFSSVIHLNLPVPFRVLVIFAVLLTLSSIFVSLSLFFLCVRAVFCPYLHPYLSPWMEFLDINLTKDSNLLLRVIHSPFYQRILKKTRPFPFKNSYKNIRETRKLEFIHEQHYAERKKERRKLEKNSSLRRLEFMPRNLD